MDVIQDLPIRKDVPGTPAGSCDPDSIASPSSRDKGVRGGEALSFDLNGDVREFFRSIAAVSRFEFGLPPSINRNVTVHLKNVPWELALDAVLNTSGLAGEPDGAVLRISTADPAKGQDRVLMGTVTVAGRIVGFNFQNPRSLLQLNAPNAQGIMQPWSVEWESADYLKELGMTPSTLRVGDQVLIVGSITRGNTIRLISIRRLSDGFSWGYLSAGRVAPFDGVMFVGSISQ